MNLTISRRRFLRQGFIAMLGASCLFSTSMARTASSDISAKNRRRSIRFSIHFHNPSDQPLERQNFWCYLPFNSTIQKLSEIKISTPYQLHNDALGHQILELEFDGIHGFFQKTVLLQVAVELHQNTDQQPLSRSQALAWLAPERYIESDNKIIIGQAHSLTRKTDEQTIRAIFDWVSNNIEYAGYLADDLGALYAQQNRRGDCTEYAYLVVALARANNIAARMIGGYTMQSDIQSDIAPKPQDYHNWAEVLIDGHWRIVDAQKRTLFPDPTRYIGFRKYRHDLVNEIAGAHRYRIDGSLQVNF